MSTSNDQSYAFADYLNGKPLADFLKENPGVSVQVLADLVNFLDTGLVVDKNPNGSFVIRQYDPRGPAGKDDCWRTFCDCIKHLQKNGLAHDPDHCFRFHRFNKEEFEKLVPILQVKVKFEKYSSKLDKIHWDDITKMFVYCNGEEPKGKRTNDVYKMLHAYKNGKPITVQSNVGKITYIYWDKEKWVKDDKCPVFGDTSGKRFAPVYRFSIVSQEVMVMETDEAPADEAPADEAPALVEILSHIRTSNSMFDTAFECLIDPRRSRSMDPLQVILWAKQVKFHLDTAISALERE